MELVERNAEVYSRKTAVSCMGQEVTYRRLLERVSALGRGLRSLGLKKGDRIAFWARTVSPLWNFTSACQWAGWLQSP